MNLPTAEAKTHRTPETEPLVLRADRGRHEQEQVAPGRLNRIRGLPQHPAIYVGEVITLALVAGIVLPTITRGGPMVESVACGAAIATIGLLERVLGVK